METNFDTLDELLSIDEPFYKFVVDTDGKVPNNDYSEIIKDLGNFDLYGDTLTDLYKKYRLLRSGLYHIAD